MQSGEVHMQSGEVRMQSGEVHMQSGEVRMHCVNACYPRARELGEGTSLLGSGCDHQVRLLLDKHRPESFLVRTLHLPQVKSSQVKC